MKKLLLTLLLIPTLALADSGIKVHGLNLGYGHSGVTATGFGIAYKSFYADYFMLPNESVTYSLSRSFNYQFSAIKFGSYIGITDQSNQYLVGYNLGTEYKSYYQPYVRFYNGIELSVIDSGAKLSFIIAR
jgi:hypothetical protein